MSGIGLVYIDAGTIEFDLAYDLSGKEADRQSGFSCR
jgi:hypothetical protein